MELRQNRQSIGKCKANYYGQDFVVPANTPVVYSAWGGFIYEIIIN